MIEEITYVSKSFLIRRKSYFLSKKYQVEKLIKDIPFNKQKERLIPIKTEDLEEGSQQIVHFYCDYCSLEERKLQKLSYKAYLFRRKIIAKDACKRHAHLKTKEIKELLFTSEELIKKEKMKSDKISKIKNSYSLEKKEHIGQKRKKTNLLLGRNNNVFSTNPEKTRNTLIQKYGCENISFSPNNTIKKEEASLIKNGYRYPSQSPIEKEKRKQKNIEKFGVPYFSQSDEFKRVFYDKLVKYFEVNNKILLLSFEDYKTKKHLINYEINLHCKKCNSNYSQSPFNLKVTTTHPFKDWCPVCNPIQKGSSLLENSFYTFISSIYSKEIKRNNRVILEGKEIDIFLPENNIGFELNGLYWHSELNGGHDEGYHLYKYKKAKEKEIKLFFIYDYEWKNQRLIIESIIKTKLGIIENRVFARKCVLKEVKYKEAKQFFNENHIQGGEIITSKDISIGLFYENILVSCLSLNKPRYNKKYQYELIRYANKLNTQILGGFSKLLSYFEKQYKPSSLITYSDIRLFQNNTYEKTGFTYLYDSPPNYFYIKNGIPVGSRYKFQKHKLSKILPLFNPDMTEWENMQNNGYDRVWDCGNRVFEKIYN